MAALLTKSAGGLKMRFSCFNGSMLHCPLLNKQCSFFAKMQQNDGF
jgi:hypothetical protein